jgi:putative endonuclease
MIWTVYVIYSEKRHKHYIDVTDNFKERLYEHNHGLSPYTKGGEPRVPQHLEEFDNIKDAYARERFLKKKKSKKILKKISSSPDVRSRRNRDPDPSHQKKKICFFRYTPLPAP